MYKKHNIQSHLSRVGLRLALTLRARSEGRSGPASGGGVGKPGGGRGEVGELMVMSFGRGGFFVISLLGPLRILKNVCLHKGHKMSYNCFLQMNDNLLRLLIDLFGTFKIFPIDVVYFCDVGVMGRWPRKYR